jgi:hypothetical protein
MARRMRTFNNGLSGLAVDLFLCDSERENKVEIERVIASLVTLKRLVRSSTLRQESGERGEYLERDGLRCRIAVIHSGHLCGASVGLFPAQRSHSANDAHSGHVSLGFVRILF